MANVREASDGCCEAREISQADVPIRAIDAPIAPAPSREACGQAAAAASAIPRVRPTDAGWSLMPAPGRGKLDHRSASAASAGRWATIKAVRPLTSARTAEEHVRLGLVVEAGGRLVEQEQRRVAHEGPRQRAAPALPGRQSSAPLTEAACRRPGRAAAPRRLPGRVEGRRHLGVGGVRPSEPDVVGDRA